MAAASIRLVGEKQLKRNLNALERQVFPRAQANAINRTATKGRKDSITAFSRLEHRKKKAFRSIIRVTKRARAKVSELAIVTLFTRKQLAEGQLSEPFRAKGKTYRRRLNGRQRTKGRPQTSSPNLPIYPILDEVANRRAKITRRECAEALRQFYPGEVREQIKKLVAKHIAKTSGA